MSGAETSPIALPSSLDLVAAQPLCRELQDRLLAGAPLLLDGGGVDRASTPCLQVLVAAGRSAAARGLRFELKDPSPALASAFADLGLQRFVTGEGL
jgi:anti-anti-sigma regulatory factor